jgi:hypothetical protein
MDKLDIILWILAGGFSISFAIMRMMWNSINSRFDKQDSKFDKIDLDIKEVRTSLNRMEGAFYSKECCMIKDSSQLKKVD